MGILGQVSLGRDDADTDHNLKHYFLTTSIVDEVIRGDKWLVSGRKGTGKTAIFKMIPELTQKEGNIIVSLTPDEYSWGALKQYKELGILPEQAHTNAWKFTLVTTMTSGFLDRFGPGRHLAAFRDFLMRNFGSTERLSLQAISAKLQTKKIEELDVGPLGLKVADATLTPKVLAALRGGLLDALTEQAVRIRAVVDRLDDSWDGSQESKSLLVGLIKAAHELNGHFQESARITVFLRSDIHDMLDFHDKDKTRQYEIQIRWDRDSLRNLIAERIRYSANLPISHGSQDHWDRAFSKRRFKGKETALKYITDRTFLRPRDMLSFCRRAIEVGQAQGHELVEPDDVRKALKDYSKWKLNDLETTEYRIKYPWLGDVLAALRGATHKITGQELVTRLEKVKRSRRLAAANGISVEQLVEVLFEVNAIGYYRLGYRYQDDTISTDQYLERALVIHPALREALNIKLKYKTKD